MEIKEQLYRVYTNAYDMMICRGYKDKIMDQKTFNKKIENHSDFFFIFEGTKTLQKASVSYLINLDCIYNDIRAEHITVISERIKEHKVKKTILILITELNVKNKSKLLAANIYNTTLFMEYEFFYNPTKHFLYSPHIKLTKKEIEKLLYDLKLPELNKVSLKKKLPLLRVNDIIVRYFDFKIGDVIKIVKKDYVNYRIVEGKDRSPKEKDVDNDDE